DPQRPAGADDERRESEGDAEIPQRRTESPEAGIPAAARVALVVADADERSARGTNHRSVRPSLKHGHRLYQLNSHDPADDGAVRDVRSEHDEKRATSVVQHEEAGRLDERDVVGGSVGG